MWLTKLKIHQWWREIKQLCNQLTVIWTWRTRSTPIWCGRTSIAGCLDSKRIQMKLSNGGTNSCKVSGKLLLRKRTSATREQGSETKRASTQVNSMSVTSLLIWWSAKTQESLLPKRRFLGAIMLRELRAVSHRSIMELAIRRLIIITILMVACPYRASKVSPIVTRQVFQACDLREIFWPKARGRCQEQAKGAFDQVLGSKPSARDSGTLKFPRGQSSQMASTFLKCNRA